MPTYVYACDSCGAQFEQFQSFKDDPLTTCPRCEGALRRVFQPVGIVFKGSGWYITDSRKSSSATVNSEDSSSKSEKPAATETTNGESSTAKTEPAKTETKVEAKATSEN